MGENVACRFLVSGRVQGVSFRFYTAKKAQALGLKGAAINLPDGRVEVVAVGESAAVLTLGEWLSEGSPLARVEHVESVSEAPESLAKYTSFRTG